MKHLLKYNDWLLEALTAAQDLTEPLPVEGGAEILNGIQDLDPSNKGWGSAWGVSQNFVNKTLEIARRIYANSPKDLAEIDALQKKLDSQADLKREDVDLFGWWVWGVMYWDWGNKNKGRLTLGSVLSDYDYSLHELLVSDEDNAWTMSYPHVLRKKWNPKHYFSLVDLEQKRLAKAERKAGRGAEPGTGSGTAVVPDP